MPTASIIFWIYVLVGPLAWVGLFTLMMLGRSRMTRLEKWRGSLPQDPPRVLILVPAKDEGPRIRHCIESILKQDYPNFSIVAIDDRSTDDTGPVLDALASEHANVRVVHVKSLPTGWLGKCHALWMGAREGEAPAGPDSRATAQTARETDWLFFVDSDVTLQPNALSAGLSLAISRQYDVLTLLTALECHTFLERLVLPLAAALWSFMFTISLTNDDNRKEIATANGQFHLMRRSAYDSIGGHEAVKDQIVEDVEMARLLKSRGHSIRFFTGAHLAATRMHANLRQMLNGWGRIYSGTARRNPTRIVMTILVLIFCGLSVYPALAWGILRLFTHHESRWLIASLIHIGVMTAMLALMYKWSRNAMRFAVLFPISAAYLLGFLTSALRICRTGRVQWRSTTYDLPAVK
jgi:cellulose synthase/poly-beta-1,6-N-acetylglucosamine synthase-like glycosyltransferase